MAFSVQGLRARAMVANRARAECIRVQASAGNRTGPRRSIGDMQVLHYRSSSPRSTQVDVEIKGTAVEAQAVITPEQKPQLAQTVSPRDLLHELQQTQVRLQMAEELGLRHDRSPHQESYIVVSAPPATIALPSNLPEPTLTERTPAAEEAPSREQGDKQASTATHKETAAGKDGQVETLALVPIKTQLKPVFFTFPQDEAATSTSAKSTSPVIEAPARSGGNSNGGKVLGGRNEADAVAATTSSTSTSTAAAPSNAPARDAAAESTVSATSTADPAATATAAEQSVKKRARVVRQEGMPVVQVAWAGMAGNMFYMPDPLAVPCFLEASKPCEPLMSYDADLAECMWLEAGRIATLKREYEEAAARQAASNSMIHTARTGGQSASASTLSTKVEFQFRCETQPGERLWLVGDNAALGSWDVKKAVKLRWSTGHVWRGAVELPIGAKVSYKGVLEMSDKQYKWQAGSNHVLEVDATKQPGLKEFR